MVTTSKPILDDMSLIIGFLEIEYIPPMCTKLNPSLLKLPIG